MSPMDQCERQNRRNYFRYDVAPLLSSAYSSFLDVLRRNIRTIEDKRKPQKLQNRKRSSVKKKKKPNKCTMIIPIHKKIFITILKSFQNTKHSKNDDYSTNFSK